MRAESSIAGTFVGRGGIVLAALVFVAMVSLLAGLRFGLMLMIGLGLGITLEALRFGFAGPWRAMILRRDPSGIWAQLAAIALVAVVALPLIAARPGELVAAQAPVGFSMVLGAFGFGIAMQVLLGCGSGTLVNAGSGNPVGILALPFFALGSFLGASHLVWWTSLGAWQSANLSGWSGVAGTILFLALIAAALWKLSAPAYRHFPKRLILAVLLVATFALLNLLVAGQPWGVVYGLGLWAAKVVVGLGVDISGSHFWAATENVARVKASVLNDYTSLTNIGILAGAFVVACWRHGGLSQKLPGLPAKAWLATVIAGLLLGYCSRLAFGCNVGAFFSGISTGSLHGWAWFFAAFAGAFFGVRLRPALGLEAKP